MIIIKFNDIYIIKFRIFFYIRTLCIYIVFCVVLLNNFYL